LSVPTRSSTFGASSMRTRRRRPSTSPRRRAVRFGTRKSIEFPDFRTMTSTSSMATVNVLRRVVQEVFGVDVLHAPYRRCRIWNDRIARRKSIFRNPGQYTSKKYSSEYASCHRRKLLIRSSPLVRRGLGRAGPPCTSDGRRTTRRCPPRGPSPPSRPSRPRGSRLRTSPSKPQKDSVMFRAVGVVPRMDRPR